MNKKFELLREAVQTYKVNHCDGAKNEKALLEFIDELEQLTIPDAVNRRELLVDFAMKRNNAPDFVRGQYERDANEYLAKIN